MSSNLRDYVVDIKGRPLEIRLQLINHLELLAEKVHTDTTVKDIKCYYYQFFFDTDNEWSCASSLKPDKNLIPISIEDFIAKFPLSSQEQPMPTLQNIKVGSHWERIKDNEHYKKGEIITVGRKSGSIIFFNNARELLIKDFLERFKPRPDLDIVIATPTEKRNLAFYKESGEPWTEDELDTVRNYCGDTCSIFGMPSSTTKRKYVYWNEDAKDELKVYPWDNQDKPKQLKQVSYESLFTETQQDSTSNKFSIGDLICYNQEARDDLSSAKGTLPNEIIGTVTEVIDRTALGSDPLLKYKGIQDDIQGIDSGWVTKYVTTPSKKQTTKPKYKPVAQQEPIQSITKETFMSKLKETASTTVEQNKQALIIASKMEAGRIINKQVLKQLAPHLPFFLQGYAKSPFAPFVVANLVAMVANHTDNSKLTKVSDLMLLGAADSGVATFNLDKIIDDILSNIKLPAGVLDDSDD